MENSKFIRTLFLLDDTRNFTNNFYIAEFVKIVLFQNGQIAMTIEELQEGIAKLTELEYTEQDIINAISLWCKSDLEEHNGAYNLTDNASREISKREKANNIKAFIHKFLNEHDGKYDITKDTAEALIDKFIFQRINENIKQISDILSNNLSINPVEEDFSEAEVTFINDFLNWDNNEKNKCIYTLIAKSCDYCMINSKCNDPGFDFSKISFYLDTNIIFRLLGIDGELREVSIKSLIERSKTAGIKLLVSNYVKSECENTISNQLQILKDKTSSLTSLLPTSSMSFAEEASVSTAFYTKYFHWVQDGNKHRNYDGFNKFIIRELNSILDAFSLDKDNPSYKLTASKDFSDNYESLYKEKKDKHVVETDVNSFFLVLDRRRNNPEQEYFLISADRKLINWLKDTYPDMKSVADLPSAWLSIILKYNGRETASDYKAFCNFIHLSIEPQIEDLEKKLEFKNITIYSDIDTTIKIEMIGDVKNHYEEYKEFTPQEMVRMSYFKSEKQIRQEIAQQKDEERERMIDQIFIKAEEKYKAQQERYNAERSADRKRFEDEKEELNKEADKKIKDARAEGYRLAKEEEKQKKIKRRIKFNKCVRTTTNILAWVILIIMVLGLIILAFKGKIDNSSEFGKFVDENTFLISVLPTIISIMIWLFKITFLKNPNNLFPTNSIFVEQNMEKREKRRKKKKEKKNRGKTN